TAPASGTPKPPPRRPWSRAGRRPAPSPARPPPGPRRAAAAPISPGPLLRLLYGASREHPRQVLLVLRGGPDIPARVEPVRGVLGGLAGRGSLAQGLLDGQCSNR